MHENTLCTFNGTPYPLLITIYEAGVAGISHSAELLPFHSCEWPLSGYSSSGSVHLLSARYVADGMSGRADTHIMPVPGQVLCAELDEYGLRWDDRTNCIRVYNDTVATALVAVYYGRGLSNTGHLDCRKIYAGEYHDWNNVKYTAGNFYRIEVQWPMGSNNPKTLNIEDEFDPMKHYRLRGGEDNLYWEVILLRS